MRWLSLLLAVASLEAQVPVPAPGFSPTPAKAITDVPMHDPVMYRQDGIYYIFATGPGVVVWSSPDRVHWTREKPVFAAPPAWTVQAVPTFKGNFWAPDISFFNGQYYLFYAISAFGKNTSCIGVATNATLDPRASGFKWVDHGKVIQSVPGVTNWNAIDPNLIVADDGTPYLTFGSFWEGIKLVKLTPDHLAVAEPLDHLPTLASRMKDPSASNPPATAGNPVDAGGNAIEAPFIFRHGAYYYLFASIDYCCRGPKSNYKMIVGRATEIPGPYVDEAGAPLARGGGTVLLAGDSKWYGVGHNGANTFDGVDYIVFHGYDASDPHGRSKLRIERLSWTTGGWPRVEVAGGSAQ
jgi:arabinan endo-1,5-alpha-L-arabinosidase